MQNRDILGVFFNRYALKTWCVQVQKTTVVVDKEHHIIAEKITVYSLAQHVRFVRCPMPSSYEATAQEEQHTNTWTSSPPLWPLSPRQRARHKCHRITGNAGAVQIILCPFYWVCYCYKIRSSIMTASGGQFWFFKKKCCPKSCLLLRGSPNRKQKLQNMKQIFIL